MPLLQQICENRQLDLLHAVGWISIGIYLPNLKLLGQRDLELSIAPRLRDTTTQATHQNVQSNLFAQGDIYLKGDASIPKNPLIGGLFTCHKNPSAPSALSRPLTVLRCLMRFSPKARGSFEAGITPPGHVCVLINLVWHRGGRSSLSDGMIGSLRRHNLKEPS